MFLYIDDKSELIHLRALGEWLIKYKHEQHNKIANAIRQQSNYENQRKVHGLRQKLQGKI